MSAHKKQGVAATKTGIVVGDGKPHRRLHLRLWGLSLVVVVAVAVATYGLIRHFTQNDTPATKTTQLAQQSKKQKPLTPQQQAEQDVYNGNFSVAQKVFDTELSKATDKKAQSDLYLSKATVAVSAQDYAQARTYAEKADTLNHTSNTTLLLGNIAEAQGDKTAATGYYKAALSLLNKQSATYGYMANQIQAKIDEVSK
jgi:tetratricopeptide (TPR) repeat protein